MIPMETSGGDLERGYVGAAHTRLSVFQPGWCRPRVLFLLCLVLPFFGQSFHYLKGVLPLWAISKAFPVITLPLTLVVLRHPRLPMTRQVMLTFLWCVLVPSFAAVFYFGQDFFTGVAAQVKMLPLLYFFSFLGLLLLLRPSLSELERSYFTLGLITYLTLVLLWLVIPESSYSGQYGFGSSPLFSHDSRGDRIRMPMYFGMITLFYGYRRFLQGDGLRWLLTAVAGFLLTLLLVKTRAMVVGAVGVVVINTFRAARPVVRLGLLLLVPPALVGLFSFDYLQSMFSTSPATGFDVRWVTAMKAIDFLGLSPGRWLVGVGTISPTNDDNFFSYFGHFFFLADITWLGVVFEYGFIGALLILLYELRALLFFRGNVAYRLNSPFLGSLCDYVIYVLLISNLYPPTLSPGETAVIMSIFAYCWYSLEREEETVWPDEADTDEDEDEPEANLAPLAWEPLSGERL